MSFSDYLENKVLDHCFRNVSYTPPTTIYLGLFTAAPTDAGGGTEVTGGSYARKIITFAASSGGVIALSSTFDFVQATGAWGTITHIGIFDALTVGNLLNWSALSASVPIAIGDIYRQNTLTVTLD